MSGPGRGDGRSERALYTPDLLALAVSLADYPLTNEFTHLGTARSRSCGSAMTLGLTLSEGGRVERCGLRLAACAVGQGSAAVFARAVSGMRRSEIASTYEALSHWLDMAGEAAGERAADEPLLARLEGFTALAPARAYPARRGAILLPWQAALDALPKRPEPR